MIGGFNCVDFNEQDFEEYESYTSGNNISFNYITNGKIDARKIQSNVFPSVSADVFISHSHNDEELAKRLAGYLENELGLTCFLDGRVWGSADGILQEIDEDYCAKHRYPDHTIYSYSLRNLSTSYVHVMLSNALMQVMDACKFIFFLNTPASIDSESAVNDPETNSPWLYLELSILKYMQRKYPTLQKSLIRESKESLIPATFPAVGIDELFELTKDMLEWIADKTGANHANAIWELAKLLK